MKQMEKGLAGNLFRAGLLVLGVGVLYFSLSGRRGFFFGRIPEFGLFCCVMLNILLLVRRSRALPCTLASMAMFLFYCILDKYYLNWGNDLRNSLIAGGAICIGSLLARGGAVEIKPDKREK